MDFISCNWLSCIRFWVLTRVFLLYMLGSVWSYPVCWSRLVEDAEDLAFIFIGLFWCPCLLDIYVFPFSHLLFRHCCTICSSFMNCYYDDVFPLHYSVTVLWLWCCIDSHLHLCIYNPIMIRVLYYLSWHVWIIVNLNGPNIRVVTVGIRALV